MNQQLFGLKGAQRIVLEQLLDLQARGCPVSMSVLARQTGYHVRTVSRAIRVLKQAELIDRRENA